MTPLDLAALGLGALLVIAGVALWSVPAALIAAGIALLAVVLLRDARDDDKEQR